MFKLYGIWQVCWEFIHQEITQRFFTEASQLRCQLPAPNRLPQPIRHRKSRLPRAPACWIPAPIPQGRIPPPKRASRLVTGAANTSSASLLVTEAITGAPVHLNKFAFPSIATDTSKYGSPACPPCGITATFPISRTVPDTTLSSGSSILTSDPTSIKSWSATSMEVITLCKDSVVIDISPLCPICVSILSIGRRDTSMVPRFTVVPRFGNDNEDSTTDVPGRNTMSPNAMRPDATRPRPACIFLIASAVSASKFWFIWSDSMEPYPSAIRFCFSCLTSSPGVIPSRNSRHAGTSPNINTPAEGPSMSSLRVAKAVSREALALSSEASTWASSAAVGGSSSAARCSWADFSDSVAWASSAAVGRSSKDALNKSRWLVG